MQKYGFLNKFLLFKPVAYCEKITHAINND